jgi:lipid A ethanolaminephosphotransferase
MKYIINQYRLIVIVAVFLVAFGNITFFGNVAHSYPVAENNLLFLFSIAICLSSFLVFLFSLAGSKYTTKPILIITVLVSSLISYFMDSYGTVIDDDMIKNIIKTDAGEALDLLNLKLIVYFLILGLLPAIFIFKIKISYGSFKRELLSKLVFSGFSLLLVLSTLLLFSDTYTSFFREHKPLRYYTNPAYFIYSFGKYVSESLTAGQPQSLETIAEDAKIPATDEDRELVILVVGETARADRFALNGYIKNTNPLLAKENVVSFTSFHSCGTATAISVPCMFSIYGRERYDEQKINSTENILDVLQRAGVNILWRDNNSDSKGVALRIASEDFKNPDHNTVCDSECRDIGMLQGLQIFIDSVKLGDIFIVLQQMGIHGPAFYKRFPGTFEIFIPACLTSQLQQCSLEEINNAYDNAITYTDYFLANIIALLKNNSSTFETAMFYISDHGESLGEHGL